MYNLKKIFRKRSNLILIIVFSLIFYILLFLFKYVFVVQEKIEMQIYDNYRNREVIVYNASYDLKERISNFSEVLCIYDDYNLLEIASDDVGFYNINFLLENDMPTLLKGNYPKNHNQIILPKFTFVNNKKIDLEKYFNKSITFILNGDIKKEFFITGIYEVIDSPYIAYSNIENINDILDLDDSLRTGNVRVLINHYKYLDNFLKKIECDANLYDTRGLEEIELYKSLFNLAILLIIIIVTFVMLILAVISNILFYDTKNDRFIQFALGYDNNMIVKKYLDYYFKIIFISIILGFLGYFVTIVLYSKYIVLDNVILNDLFNINLNCSFLLPLLFIYIIIFLLLSVFIKVKINNR